MIYQPKDGLQSLSRRNLELEAGLRMLPETNGIFGGKHQSHIFHLPVVKWEKRNVLFLCVCMKGGDRQVFAPIVLFS